MFLAFPSSVSHRFVAFLPVLPLAMHFQVNMDFSMRLIRVKVPLVTLASLGGSAAVQVEPQAGADVPASVEQDRNHL